MNKRIMSWILTFTLCLSMLPVSPVTAYAAEGTTIGASGLCEHHTEHDETCGYVEGIAETPCTHEHTEDCSEKTTSCTHTHTEDCYPVLDSGVSGNEASPSDAAEPICGHVCSEESGCITEGLNCTHTAHDDTCGYTAAVEGHDCHYVCAECAKQEQAATPTDAAEAACTCDAPDGELHTEDCALYETPADPTCTCETKCAADAIHADCPVCSAEGADLTACTGQEAPTCTCGTDDPDIHATNCPAYVTPENPACSCAEKCPEDAPNLWCDVCGVQGADACEGGETAQTYASSGTFGDNNDWSWTLDDDGTLTITGTGEMPDWTGETYEQRPWQSSLGSITKVVISDGVTSVGDYAFTECRNLTLVTLPDTVTAIGKSVFLLCESLDFERLPSNLTSIGNSAFNGCTSLTLSELPDGVNEIEASAFSECSSLAITKLPAALTSIPNSMFVNTSVGSTSHDFTVHDKINVVGAWAFSRTKGTVIFTGSSAPTLYTDDGLDSFMNFYGAVYVPATGSGYDADGWPTQTRYWYNVTIETEGGGTASASQTTIVKQGVDKVTLTAIPQEGYHFVRWDAPEGITITDNKFTIPDTYTATDNITITAVFDEHTWSTDWTQGDTTHWYDCTFESCDATSEKIAHTPSYNASGTTITGTCGDCKTGLGTATISANSGAYNGSAYDATVSGTDTMASMAWDISYTEQGGTALSAAPADAGSYTASITIGGATASVDFSIAQAEGRGTVTIEGWTYGDTANSPVPESDANGTGNVAYLYTSTDSGGYSDAAAPTNAGSYKVTATFAETRNYKEHTASAEFTISPKQAQALTIEGVEASYPYTGSAIKPEITVKDGSKTLSEGTDYTVSYGTNTTVADGGSVIITMINSNYTGSKTVNFTIEKAVPAYTAPTGLSAVYGQTLNDVSLDSGTGDGAWSWADGGASVGNAGTQTHEATFTPNDTDNYQTMTISLDVEVEKAELALSANAPAAAAIEYGQKLAASTLSSGAVKNKTTGQSVDGAWSWADGTLRPDGAGTYTADAVFTAYDHENHDTLTVTGIPVTVSAAAPNIVIAPDPASAIEGETVSVKVTVTNPHDSTLTGPEAALTYQIGGDTAQILTGGSFTIPEGTPTDTVITITANTQVEGSYLAANATATVIVTDCPHTGTTVLDYDGTAHWHHCNRCGADIGKEAHSGGTATCTEKATCSTCGQPHGDLDSTNHVGATSAGWQHDDNYHWQDCACGAQLGKEAHSGGVATCIEKAACSDCGQPHGSLNPNNHATASVTTWEHDDTHHWGTCACGESIEKTAHSGGTATCKDPAACSTCGQPHGDVDAANHTGQTETRGRIEATTTREGYTGDTYCLGCGEKIASGTTIPKKPSSGGTGGNTGGGDSGNDDSGNDDDGRENTPADPPSTPVTVPVSGDENTIHVGASVSGTKATIDDIDLSTLNAVIGDHVKTGIVTIDFSGLNKDIDTVEIPSNVVKQIAEAVNNPNNDAESLEIVFTDGTSIEFDAQALGEKSAQAGGLDITISIKHTTDSVLNNRQQQTVGNRPAYDINVTSGGKHISDMGGKVTIHAPYELRPGERPEHIIVYYVDDDGRRERCETSYDSAKRRVNWRTDHLSVYMIGYEEPQINPDTGGEEPPKSPDTGDNTPAYVTHTVQKGDTLWAIAKKYGCTIAEIVAVNSDLIKDPNLILVGWQLKIPQGGAAGTDTNTNTPDAILPDDKKTGVYIVKRGDTLWAISRKYGCTVEVIVALNGELIIDPDLIFAGWELKIPQD